MNASRGPWQFPAFLVFSMFSVFSLSSCMSAYTRSLTRDSPLTLERVYLTDFNTAWTSVLDSLKNSRMDITNREGGFIQTKWTDNTAEKNFTDSFENSGAYLKAQYRFKVTVAPGKKNDRSTAKVTVMKEQMVQRDVLEGWRPLTSDSIDETTLLYRIGRLIYIKMKLAQFEDEKTQKEIQEPQTLPDKEAEEEATKLPN